MRNLFGLLCLLLAGVLSVTGLAGHQINQLLRTEEPVAQIAGTLPQQQDFSDSVSALLVDDLTSRLPAELQSLVPGGVDSLVAPVISSAMDNDRTQAAWDQVLQTTRTDYTTQLETLFAEGTSGDLRELDIEIDLSPITEAMTQPLREGLDSAAGWIPGVDLETFDFIAPEFSIDIQAATESTADPYTWATGAVISEYWWVLALGAGGLTLLGLLLGTGRFRWYSLASGAVLAGALGLWIATTYAAPPFHHSPGLPEAAGVILDHLRTEFTAWAQPAWWAFCAGSAAVVAVGVTAALMTRTPRRSTVQY